jgi:SAM-dependent methyltransferase
MGDYVHGYSDYEEARLRDQADSLAVVLHEGTCYPPGANVLEAGCGVGAQTVHLAANSPGACFTSIDLAADSLKVAMRAVAERGFANVRFRQADLYDLPFPESSFDHAFVCFVLEHVPDPIRALACVRSVVRPGGTITAIEGDHGSAFFHPQSDAAWRTIRCLVDLQAASGGNALIGRSLYPLLRDAGFRDVEVVPRTIYADAGRPEWVDGFTRKTFIAMVEGVEEPAIARGLIERAEWDRGIAELKRTAGESGTFVYTFFKGVGRR